MKNKDVIIIGGGVIGCAIAYYLSKQHVKVLVLEKEEIGAGGSSRNGGGVRQSARDPRELPLAMHAIRNIWPGLSDELGVDVEYCQKGNLRLAKTEEHIKILERAINQGCSAGLDLKLIDQKEVRDICPYVSEDVIAASFWNRSRLPERPDRMNRCSDLFECPGDRSAATDVPPDDRNCRG